MDDGVDLYGDVDALIAGIESGWETQKYYERHGHVLEQTNVYYPLDTTRLDPQLLEDLEPEEEPYC